MRTSEKYYFYYKTNDCDKFIVQSIKECKYPKRTKEYKRIRWYLISDQADVIGFCTEDHYNRSQYEFINTLPNQ